MGLMEKIADDMKTAMKSGEKLRLETLRTLRAGLLEMQVEKRPSGGMTPEDEMSVLISASKKRKESIDIFRANGRNELADQESLELSIIQEYLPKQMSAAEVEEVVKKAIADSGASTAKDFPKVMGPVMKDLKGKADGKMIQETVKRLLGA
jgi:uncharacterized protein YqeY